MDLAARMLTPGSWLGKRRLLTLLIALLGLAAGYLASQLVLSGDNSSLLFMLLGVGAAVAIVIILNDWRKGLYMFFGWLFVEDLARKYLGNNMAIFFAKDFLLLLVYLSFFQARRNRKVEATFKPPFRVPLLLFLWFAMAQVFNPASPSVFYGILGLKLYFLYVPLMYVGYALLDSEQSLRRFLLFNALLLLVVGGLGIAQSVLGHTFLNPAVMQEDIRDMSTLYRASPITGLMAYRPTSVFVSTGRFQNLIVASWMILLGFGGYLILRSKKGRIPAFLAVGVLAVAAVMSASRGVVMWCGGSSLVIAAAFLWGAPWKQREASRVVRSIQRFILLGGLSILTMTLVFPEQVGSRMAIYSETLNPYSSASELAYRTREYPLQNFLAAFDTPRWAGGYGTGTASLGIQYVARILHTPQTGIEVENGYGQLVIELGIVGLLLWIILGASIALSAWKIVIRLRGSPWFPLAFVIFWTGFLIFFPMGYSSLSFYQDYLVNAYFWILIGMLYRLPSLALSAQFAARKVPVPSFAANQAGIPVKPAAI